ncbi:class I SAM-dependent methyltransferase [Nostoc sp.]|uniref:class I SAM-dependent methyltransferase n=1 Tax=Nostoc sp. TaxID=1180 RepID=UPI002FF82DD0
MIQIPAKLKAEYGDFQTPSELAEKICHKLLELDVIPDVIVEPTCGIGNFIQAAANSFPSASKIIGLEINQDYIQEISKNNQLLNDQRIQVQQGNFFEFDWSSLSDEFSGKILMLGNFPWVTNSQQGLIGGENLPQKNNFQNHKGLEAITGKSNFDISEWMLIHSIQWLQKHEAYLAMLCKTSVSRKLLNYIHSQSLNLAYCATYKIDAKKYFNATVDACLLFCKFDLNSQNYFCDVFNNLNSNNYYRIGYRNNTQIRDVTSFDKLQDLHNPNMGLKWRSGIKHDSSVVMELSKVNDIFTNGLGEVVDIEETYLFPLAKGSDVAQNRTKSLNRYVLVTQRCIGETTEYIRDLAPKTWEYLETHSEYLDSRKSKIYKNSFRFSIFGVGSYTFAPWKIAICGLYKKLDFRLVGKMDGKAIVFDDTVYFLSFDDEQVASQIFALLTSIPAIEFYSSLIFWDEKRPIKSSILNTLNLSALAKRLSIDL